MKGLSRYERFINTWKVCQGLNGLSRYEGLSRHEGFVKILGLCQDMKGFVKIWGFCQIIENSLKMLLQRKFKYETFFEWFSNTVLYKEMRSITLKVRLLCLVLSCHMRRCSAVVLVQYGKKSGVGYSLRWDGHLAQKCQDHGFVGSHQRI